MVERAGAADFGGMLARHCPLPPCLRKGGSGHPGVQGHGCGSGVTAMLGGHAAVDDTVPNVGTGASDDDDGDGSTVYSADTAELLIGLGDGTGMDGGGSGVDGGHEPGVGASETATMFKHVLDYQLKPEQVLGFVRACLESIVPPCLWGNTRAYPWLHL